MRGLRSAVAISCFAVFGLAYAQAVRAACTEGCVFRPAFPLASQENVEAVAVGDLNGDGRLDIAAGGRLGTNTVYVYLQAADRTFLPPVAYQYSGNAGQSIWAVGNSIDTGDLNGDGRTDVVVTTSHGIRVMLQDAQGRLGSYRDYLTSAGYRLRVGDFNSDRRLDVAAIGGTGGGVAVFYQNAAGELDAPVIYSTAPAMTNDIEVGDLNHDGLTDIAVMNHNNNSYPGIGVLLQVAGGGFQAPAYYDLFDSSGLRLLPNSIGLGDVTGDGRADLVGSDHWNSIIAVLAQNPGGTLSAPVYYPTNGGISYRPGATAIADMNQDGRGDVVVLGDYGVLDVFLQTADGLLAPAISQSGNVAVNNTDPHSLTLADLDSDGKQDAVVGRDVYYGGVDVYLGNRAEVTVTLTTDRAEALVDQPVRYTATLVNRGPDVATGVRFAHKLTAGMFSNGLLTPSQGRCDDIKRTCELGALAVGQSATVTFEAYAYENPGTYANTVTVVAYPQDREPADNSATAVVTVTVGADLGITDHLVSRPYGSSELRYTIYISNDGPVSAENVVVTDRFPAGFTPTGASWSEWGGTRSGSCAVGAAEAVCSLGTVKPTNPFDGNYPIVVSVRGVPAPGANPINVVTVGAATGDPRTNDNRSERLSDLLGNAINQPPVIASGGPYTVRLGAAVVLDARATRDPEGQWVDYQWDFPDGSHAWDGQGRYTFTTPGLVPVTLRASDRDGASSVETVTVNVVNTDPVADAGAPYYMARKYHQVAFDAARSYDLDGGALQYAWNFGDAGTGSGDKPFHGYARSGEYLARVTVSDGSSSATDSNRVIVINTPPVAETTGPYTVQKNQAVTLDGSRSHDGDYDTLSYAWTLGDGNTATGPKPVHTYARGGSYSVSLTVNDGEVNSAPVTTTVTVVNHPPVANGAGPYEVVKNQSLVLNGSGSSDPDGDPLSYRWNFGDGTSGTGATPTHTYTKTGRYTVTLVVNDGEVDSVPYQTTVSVKSR